MPPSPPVQPGMGPDTPPSQPDFSNFTRCTNECRWPSDTVCDDGGEGAPLSVCQYGTDCEDCGARVGFAPPAPAPAQGACPAENLYGGGCGVFLKKTEDKWMQGVSCRGMRCRIEELCCADTNAECCENNVGAIVGAVIGGAFALVLVAAACCFCCPGCPARYAHGLHSGHQHPLRSSQRSAGNILAGTNSMQGPLPMSHSSSDFSDGYRMRVPGSGLLVAPTVPRGQPVPSAVVVTSSTVDGHVTSVPGVVVPAASQEGGVELAALSAPGQPAVPASAVVQSHPPVVGVAVVGVPVDRNRA